MPSTELINKRTPPEKNSETLSSKRHEIGNAMNASNSMLTSAHLTPMSTKDTEVSRVDGDGDFNNALTLKSDEHSPKIANENSFPSPKSAAPPSTWTMTLNGYSVNALTKSAKQSQEELLDEFYINAPTEPNSLDEWIDYDIRIPLHCEFFAAIKKCVNMGDEDRIKERELRRKREWATIDLSRESTGRVVELS
jgi:hypothetical protein